MQATKPVKNPRKQRKLLYNAPAHLRHKFVSASLSPELIASKGIKTLPVRKGDTVRILRGEHKGFEGKISRVDLKNYRVYVEGLTREKVDGTTIFVPVHPSKVIIKNLSIDDKWRKAIVERKKGLEPAQKEEKIERAVEKPPKKVAKVKEEKPVEAKAAVVERLQEKKPKARKKKRVPKKPVAKKKKDEKLTEKEKTAKKEKKTKAAEKTRVKRKAASEKEGGT